MGDLINFLTGMTVMRMFMAPLSLFQKTTVLTNGSTGLADWLKMKKLFQLGIIRQVGGGRAVFMVGP